MMSQGLRITPAGDGELVTFDPNADEQDLAVLIDARHIEAFEIFGPWTDLLGDQTVVMADRSTYRPGHGLNRLATQLVGREIHGAVMLVGRPRYGSVPAELIKAAVERGILPGPVTPHPAPTEDPWGAPT